MGSKSNEKKADSDNVTNDQFIKKSSSTEIGTDFQTGVMGNRTEKCKDRANCFVVGQEHAVEATGDCDDDDDEEYELMGNDSDEHENVERGEKLKGGTLKIDESIDENLECADIDSGLENQSGKRSYFNSQTAFDANDDPGHAHPLIGRRVQVTSGPYSGTVGTLLAVRTRGWWILDNVKAALRARQCKFMDDGVHDTTENSNGNDDRTRLPCPLSQHDSDGSLLSNQRNDAADDQKTNFTEEQTVQMHDATEDKKPDSIGKRTRSQLDESSLHCDSNGNSSQVQRDEVHQHGPSVLRMSDLLASVTEPPAKKIYCDHSEKLLAHPKPGVSPPIVLEGDAIPSAFDHLNPELKIQIFDRKQGIVLDKHVTVKDLPALLRRHVEYEPIVPAKGETELSTVREGRSAANLLISVGVRPQAKHPLKGTKVLITSGFYQGKEGYVQARIPGGWLLVDGLERDLTVAVQPDFAKDISNAPGSPTAEHNSFHAQLNGNKDHYDASSVNSMFTEALDATIRASSEVSKSRLDALRNDKRSVEMQLATSADDDTLTRRLRKRFDYITSCLSKAEKDYEIEQVVARTTQAVANQVVMCTQQERSLSAKNPSAKKASSPG